MSPTNSSNKLNHIVSGRVHGSSVIRNLAIITTLLFIFLIPWGNVIWDGFTRIFGIAAFGSAFLLFLVHGTHKKYYMFHLLVMLFGGWLIFTLMWSPDIETGRTAATTAIQLVLISLLISLVLDNKNKLNMAYQSYVLGTVVGSSIIIYNFINGIESKYYGRYGIENYEVDGVSIILALSIPMAAYLTTQYKNKLLKLLNILAIPLCILAIFLTATRTASIVAIIGVLYWLYTYRKSNFKIKTLLLGFFVISIIGVFTLAPKASVDRLFSSGKSISSGTLNSRTVIWGAALDQWKKSPVIGNGIGSLYFILNSSHVEYSSAHNTYIQILTEDGLIGLVLYLSIIMSIFYYIFKAPVDERMFLLSLFLVSLLSQLTMNSLFDKETWFVLTMLAIHAHMVSTNTTHSSHVI